MKAKVLKVVAIESHSTVKQVLAALKEVMRAEGKDAGEWTVVVVEKADAAADERPSGIVTGMSYAGPPDVSHGYGGRVKVQGFKKDGDG